MEKAIRHSKVSIYDYFFANKVRKTYLSLGVSVILIIIFLLFALRPTILTVGTIREKITQYDEMNTKLEKKIQAGQKLLLQQSQTSQQNPEGLKDEILFMGKVFTNSYTLKNIYLNIQKRANANNLVVVNIAPDFQQTQAGVVSYDTSTVAPSNLFYEVSVSFEGKSLSDVQNYIKTLEGLSEFPIISRVKSITITDNIASQRIPNPDLNKPVTSNVILHVIFVIYLDTQTQKPESLKQ